MIGADVVGPFRLDRVFWNAAEVRSHSTRRCAFLSGRRHFLQTHTHEVSLFERGHREFFVEILQRDGPAQSRLTTLADVHVFARGIVTQTVAHECVRNLCYAQMRPVAAIYGAHTAEFA